MARKMKKQTPSSASGVVTPALVVPRRMTKEDFIGAYSAYYRRRPLLEKKVKAAPPADEIHLEFVPILLYSGTAEAEITFDAEDSIAVTNDRNADHEITDYRVTRGGTARYSGVRVGVSEDVCDPFLQNIAAGDLSGAIPIAESEDPEVRNYRKKISSDWDAAKEVIEKPVSEAFRSTVRHMDVTEKEHTIHCRTDEITGVLMPVWTRTCSGSGFSSRFAMNAATGQIAGDLPMSTGKLLRTILISFLGAGGGLFFVLWFIGHMFGGSTTRALQAMGLLAIFFGFFVARAVLAGHLKKMKVPASEQFWQNGRLYDAAMPDVISSASFQKSGNDNIDSFRSANTANGTCGDIRLTDESEKVTARKIVNSKGVAVMEEKIFG